MIAAVDVSLKSVVVGLTALAGTVGMLRVAIRYERTFIKDQGDEIGTLRTEQDQMRAALRLARTETDECVAERAKARRRADTLERTIERMRYEIASLKVRLGAREDG